MKKKQRLRNGLTEPLFRAGRVQTYFSRQYPPKSCARGHFVCSRAEWRLTMVKVLVAGDVKGSVTQLLAKVAQYHK